MSLILWSADMASVAWGLRVEWAVYKLSHFICHFIANTVQHNVISSIGELHCKLTNRPISVPTSCAVLWLTNVTNQENTTGILTYARSNIFCDSRPIHTCLMNWLEIVKCNKKAELSQRWPRDALYIGCPEKFRWVRPRLLFRKFLVGFYSDRFHECAYKIWSSLLYPFPG